MTTPITFFYFSEIEKITYIRNKEEEKDVAFNYNSNNYISFNLYIENRINYIIKKICRKPCSYCRKSDSNIEEIDCQILKGEAICSNTPEVYFTFDKHYIALKNSTYKYGEKDSISTLTIDITGENKNEVQQLIYYHYTSPTNFDGPRNINRQNDNFKLTLSKGKYTFQYRFNNKNYNIRDIVLVTTYDYEIFDFSDFSNKCIFYDLDLTISGLLVSINPNPIYDFKNDVTLAYLLLELNGIELPYNGEKGYKITEYSLFNNINFFNQIYFKESNISTKKFVFTTFYNISINTINRNNLYGFYYKDNIIFNQQNCKSNNIYIKSLSNPSESFSLLQCDYSDLNRFQYCDAIKYQFSFKTNDYFYLYIGNNKLNTSFAINIYNSIKDSNFALYYIKPKIYIESLNFDMEKISQFNINSEPIINFNIISNSNSITYIYEVDNRTENKVTELKRKDHGLDRSNTIKVKKVNLKIERKKCPNFTVLVLGESGSWCLSCDQIALSPGGNGLNIWYQNGQCVPYCSGDYSIYDQIKHYCLNCSERTSINGVMVCGCREGTVKSPLDGVCYLPEDPEIQRVLLTKPNALCYRIDGITHNYCRQETTSKCEIVSYSGVAFPICHCKDGYTGKYCENKIKEINLNNSIDEVLNSTINGIIDGNDPFIISKIRGIIYFIEKDNSYINNIDIKKINLFIDVSINCINNAINEKHSYPQIFDIIQITVHFVLFKINNSKRLRLLEEEETNKDNLNFILNNIHYLNYLSNSESGNNYNIQSDKQISFISYKANAIDNSFRAYINSMASSNSIIGYINLLNNYVGNENSMVILTIISKKLFNLDSLEDGIIVNSSFSNNDINLRNINNFYAYIYSPNLKVNSELSYYYQTKNISIYDKNDPCFTDPCFTSKNFEYDLTQKYRKTNVFQKLTLNNEVCHYHSFEIASYTSEILCQKFEDFGQFSGSINYATLNLTFKTENIDSKNEVFLPLRCRKKMGLGNYAFWVFFIIYIFGILYILVIYILNCGSLKKVLIEKGLDNDGLLKKNSNSSNSTDNKSVDEKLKDAKKNDINNEEENKDSKPIESNNITLFECILLNFNKLHPLSAFCRVSILSSLQMNSYFFVFNTLCLFGFNGFLYFEDLIEKRIYDNKRNYFNYPMRKEFHKIILSILSQIVITFIIKVIILVSLEQKNKKKKKINDCVFTKKETEIIDIIDQFNNQMRYLRCIGVILMTIIIAFFFYYNILFCEMYINTQTNLVFSWVWSLFWEWVILAPIYILIISCLENKKSNTESLVFYLKRLFFF